MPEYSDNDFFRMGAAVAVGELYDSGRLGKREEIAEEVRGYLASFGVRSLQDIRYLGITGPYASDFEMIFPLVDQD